MIKVLLKYLIAEVAIGVFFDQLEKNFASAKPLDGLDVLLFSGDVIDVYMRNGDDYASVEYVCGYDGEILIYAEGYDYQMIKLLTKDIELIEVISRCEDMDDEFVDENEELVDALQDYEDSLTKST